MEAPNLGRKYTETITECKFQKNKRLFFKRSSANNTLGYRGKEDKKIPFCVYKNKREKIRSKPES